MPQDNELFSNVIIVKLWKWWKWASRW